MLKYAFILAVTALRGVNGVAMSTPCTSETMLVASSSTSTSIASTTTSTSAVYFPLSTGLASYTNTTNYTGPPCVCNSNSSALLTGNYGNGTSIADEEFWTGPDWESFNATYPPITPISPEPVPNPITDPTVIQLVVTAQDQLLLQYNTLGVIGCLAQGNTWIGTTTVSPIALIKIPPLILIGYVAQIKRIFPARSAHFMDLLTTTSQSPWRVLLTLSRYLRLGHVFQTLPAHLRTATTPRRCTTTSEIMSM